jgi:hypothetical protein
MMHIKLHLFRIQHLSLSAHELTYDDLVALCIR